MADSDMRLLIRGSIDRAITDAKKRRDEKVSADVTKANAETTMKAQALERQGFEDAAKRGLIDPVPADQLRATHFDVPASERSTPEQLRQQQADTDAFMRHVMPKHLQPETAEQEFYRTTPADVLRDLPLPPRTTNVDELGRHTAMSADEIKAALELESYLRDQEIERELSAPMPTAPAPTPAPPPGMIISDERAKVNIVPSTVNPLSPHVSGPISGAGLNPVALRTDPHGRRIDSNDPRAFVEDVQPLAVRAGDTGLAATSPRSVELGATYRDEVADAKRKPSKAKAKGGESSLADTDEATRKRILDSMSFIAALPKFAMVDVGGRYRG